MCGIVGFIAKDENRIPTKVLLKKMTDSIQHRGPDAEGQFIDRRVGLGHRRLAIIDISENGNQPMHSIDGNFTIVFNGEIYNYVELKKELSAGGSVFANDTDTEVIMEAYRKWGKECVTHFNGMWAFALYDKSRQEIFISRDRFGIKPLYFIEREDAFIFASEIKAILEVLPDEKIPNEEMVFRYLKGDLEDIDDITFYKNIKRFQQGFNMIYQLNGKCTTYWEYWNIDAEKCHEKWIKGKNPYKTFRTLLEDSIRIRLRSDVEVGACLSGGIDSSVIVGIATKKFGKKLHTFSSIYTEKDCNEKKYIDAVNKFNNTKEHLIYPKIKANFLEELYSVMIHHDGPDAGASLFSQYSVMKGIHGNVKVVLDGQGADELFGGYIPYFNFRLRDILNSKTFLSKWKAIIMISRYYKEWPEMLRFLDMNTLKEVFGDKFLVKLNKTNLVKNMYQYERKLFTDDFEKKGHSNYVKKENVVKGALNEVLYLAITKNGIPNLLHNEDGNSMAFSIETRLPFLDYRIVEFAMALDGRYKIKNEWTKWIVRKSCKKYIPSSVFYRKNKMGFPAPFDKWLKESSQKEEFKKIIFSLGKRNIVRPETIEEYYNQHLENQVDRSHILYKFLKLEMWFREFIDSGISKEVLINV